jgi:hypothetical protein
VTVADALRAARLRLTEEELALLGHSDLVADSIDESNNDELDPPGLLSFRERLLLGDISW